MYACNTFCVLNQCRNQVNANCKKSGARAGNSICHNKTFPLFFKLASN